MNSWVSLLNKPPVSPRMFEKVERYSIILVRDCRCQLMRPLLFRGWLLPMNESIRLPHPRSKVTQMTPHGFFPQYLQLKVTLV